ncbi:hypothetical protein [Polaromonas sp. UC242_47]|uniref:hypothetical protein n=1 Tax=Polaromonas sp. UC242_47 TaxID=3374626 RepID=UPI0037B76400
MGRISEATDNLYNKDVRVLKEVQEANIHLLYASRAQMGLLAASTMESVTPMPKTSRQP